MSDDTWNPKNGEIVVEALRFDQSELNGKLPPEDYPTRRQIVALGRFAAQAHKESGLAQKKLFDEVKRAMAETADSGHQPSPTYRLLASLPDEQLAE